MTEEKPSFSEKMRQLLLELVVVFDEAATILIYRYLLFFMAIASGLLLIVAYRLFID